MNTINKSNLFKLAWQFVKTNGFTFKEALKKAWVNLKLKAKMLLGIVKFYYLKVNGEVREAYGTLKQSLLPNCQQGSTNFTCQNILTLKKTNFDNLKKQICLPL